MEIRPRRFTVLVLLFAVSGVALVEGTIWFRHWRSSIHPDHRFVLSAKNLKEWKSFDGSWEILNGAIHNNSAERGAKLVTGSTKWTDYTLQVDIKFDGDHGDMGAILRSSDEEAGVDAYRGYYAGLRTTDGTLVIGRADHGWMEARPVAMPGGVHSKTWYRLTATGYRCSIAATSENLSTHQMAYVVMDEHPCVQSGRIGLRSVATGGSWRNISVIPAGPQDLLNVRQHVQSVSHPEYPAREADYNRLLPLTTPTSATAHSSIPAPQPTAVQTRIGDLLNLQAQHNDEVTLRGVVTLTSPALYIQDSTGAIRVESATPLRLNTGDVVEVHGHVQPGLYSASIRSRTVQFLWNGTPVSPISVTPAQAASGSYDARYVEIEGTLTNDEIREGTDRVLTFTDGIQTFRAVDTRRADETVHRIDAGSTLRVRGICVLDKAYTEDLTPFVVLLPSSSDIQVVADPPWWNPWHESLLFACVLIAALLAQVAYFRFRRWKSDTITRERERLAHEIHDTMAQGFAGVGYQIQGIYKTVAAKAEIDRSHVAEQLRLAYQLVRRCHEEASRTIAMLAPATPPTADNLLEALAEAARRIAGGAIKVNTEITGQLPSLPLRISNALLHIGREAVVNAAAHGAPSQIAIILSLSAGVVELVIKDNGRGFAYTPEQAGYGILGMQKRTRDISGSLVIDSAPGAGTEVRISAHVPEATPWSRVMNAMRSLLHNGKSHNG